ncbi:MAG TPA: AMP-binding protein, partial [Anaeromyxobacteraceae bacterium]|nr:AMP-binding protein [Anaeromyxobacteraceae bacterium]
MTEPSTVADLVLAGAPGAPAVGAPEGAAPLTYAALADQAARTVERLNALGIGRGDRVAMVLPNGPESATAFVCIAAAATTAPLNPTYRAEEFEFYLSDLGAKALVVQAGAESPALAVAGKLGIPVVELHPERARGAGAFRLEPMRP